jgi:SecD/SecF fusion protein
MGGFGATLTLPGIAGLALTIGMAVDSNIIVFERIREELRAGRTLRKAVELGFKRSFLTIVDANVTTLIAAAVLYWIGRGPIQGFGVTLAVGIGATLFCAITVTRLLIELSLERNGGAELGASLVPASTNIDFVGQMRVCSAISAGLVAVSLIGWAIFGFNLGIDFKGGTQLQLAVPAQAGATDEARLRAAFEGSRFGDVEVTRLGEPGSSEFVLRTAVAEARAGSDPTHTLGAEIQDLLTKQLGAPVVFQSIESVGPRMGDEIARSALTAIAITTILILGYVWVRFDRVYAPGAVLALLHDVIVAMGVFVWFGIEVDQNIVAALLVILGYSINDTVVIYDRIRENTTAGAARISDVVNASLNQTLSRTLLTSGFTLASVIALLLFGGPVLRGLSLALLVGMVSGVYSTVYVASAILIGLDRRRGRGRPWLASASRASSSSAG